jgi:hypothetical protein
MYLPDAANQDYSSERVQVSKGGVARFGDDVASLPLLP